MSKFVQSLMNVVNASANDCNLMSANIDLRTSIKLKKFMRILFVFLVVTTFIGISAFPVAHSENSHSNISFSSEDSLEADRMKYMNEVMASIRGKEKLPADSVFKNLKVIRGLSAEHLL